MRPILRPALAILLAFAAPVAAQDSASPPDPAALNEARAIIAVMFPPEQREQTFAGLIRQFSGQIRNAVPPSAVADPGLKAVIDGYAERMPERLMPIVTAHLPNILDATAAAYTREFSLDELRQIHAFAQTPAGRHYLLQSASTIADPAVAAANTAYIAAVQQFQATARQELAEQVLAYLQAHPDIAARLIEQNTAQ